MKNLPSFILIISIFGLWSCSDDGNPVGSCSQGLDCAGECGGTAIIDLCGECGGSGLNDNNCCGDATDCIQYSPQIQLIFDNKCISCHTSSHSSGLDLSNNASYTSLTSNNVIVSGDHANSKIWQYINSGYMPMNSDDLSTDNINIIAQWIDEGALDN